AFVIVPDLQSPWRVGNTAPGLFHRCGANAQSAHEGRTSLWVRAKITVTFTIKLQCQEDDPDCPDGEVVFIRRAAPRLHLQEALILERLVGRLRYDNRETRQSGGAIRVLLPFRPPHQVTGFMLAEIDSAGRRIISVQS